MGQLISNVILNFWPNICLDLKVFGISNPIFLRFFAKCDELMIFVKSTKLYEVYGILLF